MEAAIVHHI